jgi:alkylhydroperoxidase family enzyme
MRADELRVLAPEAFSAFDVVRVTVEQTTNAALEAIARSQVDAALRGVAATVGVAPAVARFAEQFVVDVSALGVSDRTAAMTELGAEAFEFVQLVYVFDWRVRLDAAFRQCFSVEGIPVAPASAAGSLWEASEAMFAAVARLRELDPLTTELVRLRGARAHNCRLCKSLRSVRPANEGIDESVYDQIDAYEASNLTPSQKTALRLVDALIWRPLTFPDGLVVGLHDHFAPAQVVELCFDVARNAANKIAVAFGADEPHVVQGVEYFDTDDRGELVYGLAPTRE